MRTSESKEHPQTYDSNAVFALGPEAGRTDTGRENSGSTPGHNCVSGSSQDPGSPFVSLASAAKGPSSGIRSCGASKTTPGLRGYGSSPSSRNSVAIAPRSRAPPISGSGSSHFALRGSAFTSPSPGAGIACGTKTRSTASSTSWLRGSSVTTQLCPTVAKTTPVTRRPSAPCRVTSNFASRRGKSRKPAIRATSARTALSAARSKCPPVGAMSSIATGTRHGGIADFCGLFSLMRNRLRARIDDLAAEQRTFVLLLEPLPRGARIARQPHCPAVVATRILEDIACQRLLKLPIVGCGQSGKIYRLPAVKGFREVPHLFRHSEIANAHLAQIVVEIAAKRVEQALSNAAA